MGRAYAHFKFKNSQKQGIYPKKLEISTFQSCTEKGEKSCKNGGKCTKGKCNCPDGFKGDLCEEQFYRTKSKIQKALKIQGMVVAT